MNSRELSVVSAALLLLAAGACLALAVTIARRVARRRPELNLLLLAFAVLGAQDLALGAGRLLGEGLGAIGPRAQFLLLEGGELLGLLCLALCAHFLVLARHEPGQRPSSGWVLLGAYGPLLPAAAWSRAGGIVWGYFVGFLWIIQLATMAELCPGRSRLRGLAAFLFRERAKSPAGTLRGFLLAREVNAFLALVNGTSDLMIILFLSGLAGPGPLTREIVRTGFELWPLHLALLLVYFKTRLVFLDVIVKRAVLAATLLAASVTCSVVALAALPRVTARPGPLALGFGVAGFAAGWLVCHRRLERALDRYFFRRPDFARLEAELGDEMRRCADARSLLDRVAAGLREGFGADYVRHANRSDGGPPDGMTAEVALASDGRHWGYFLCGPRQGGQLYRSEDLAFLAAIGAQAAGMLSNFALREEREARERRERELLALATQAELRALRAQVNPHFLYNALNTLADLTRDDPALAEEMVLNLARVFRFALNASRREEVTLGEEADFLTAYLEVERMRFEDRLGYRLRIPEVLRDLRLPPLLIQPLVENAVLHGITLKPGGGRVEVSALLECGRLCIRVADDGLGFDPSSATPGERTGSGLASVRARVELLSGPGHWSVSSAPGAGTVVEFEVEVKAAEIIQTGFIVS